jgi:hypothetical protein
MKGEGWRFERRAGRDAGAARISRIEHLRKPRKAGLEGGHVDEVEEVAVPAMTVLRRARPPEGDVSAPREDRPAEHTRR